MTSDSKHSKPSVCVCCLCLKALSSTKMSAYCSQCLHPLWFSCHYLLIKVENNSPGPGHLVNDKPHSSVRAFGSATAVTALHPFISYDTDQCKIRRKPLHLLPVQVYLRGFLLISAQHVIGYAPEAKCLCEFSLMTTKLKTQALFWVKCELTDLTRVTLFYKMNVGSRHVKNFELSSLTSQLQKHITTGV